MMVLILLFSAGLTGCGSGSETPPDSGEKAPVESTDDKADDSTGSVDVEEGISDKETESVETESDQNSLKLALNYSDLISNGFADEDEAAEMLFDTSLEDALSESLFYMSKSDRAVFSDTDYPDVRDDLVLEIILTSKNLEDDTLLLLKEIDELQASILSSVNQMDANTLPSYFDSMHVVHSEYMASVIEGQLNIDALSEAVEGYNEEPYVHSWNQEMAVMARMMNSIEAFDYLSQLLIDGLLLQDYMLTSEDENIVGLAGELEEAIYMIDTQTSLIESLVNRRRDIVSMLQTLEEADEYYSLAMAKAVMESADAAKELLMEDFPEDLLTEDDIALIDAQIDYYVSASESFYDLLLNNSEYALVVPEPNMEEPAPAVATILFGIAYADENSEAVQLKQKAEVTTLKKERGAFSIVGSLVDGVKSVVTGSVDLVTNVVSKTADVAYGAVKGTMAALKHAVGIDDKDAFREQIKSVKRIISGEPGEVARVLSDAAKNLQSGLEKKIGKALDYVPFGNVLKKPLNFTVKGYTSLVRSLADAFDGKKPASEKILNLVKASGLYKADMLMKAKDMLVSAGEEELQKMIPDEMKQFYTALKEVAASVDQKKEKLFETVRQSVRKKIESTEGGQKIKAVTETIENSAKSVKNDIETYKTEVSDKVIEYCSKTKKAEEAGPRKITEKAEAKVIDNAEKQQEGAGGERWPHLSAEMKVLLLGFEEDLKAKALQEAADLVENLKNTGKYSGYAMRLTYGGGVKDIGMANSKIHFIFNEKTVEVKFFISGTNVMDLDGVVKFSSYERNGDSVKMSTVDNFIGPLSITGNMMGDTYSGVINFSLENTPANITFRASKTE